MYRKEIYLKKIFKYTSNKDLIEILSESVISKFFEVDNCVIKEGSSGSLIF
jgi:hypothetical protein